MKITIYIYVCVCPTTHQRGCCDLHLGLVLRQKIWSKLFTLQIPMLITCLQKKIKLIKHWKLSKQITFFFDKRTPNMISIAHSRIVWLGRWANNIQSTWFFCRGVVQMELYILISFDHIFKLETGPEWRSQQPPCLCSSLISPNLVQQGTKGYSRSDLGIIQNNDTIIL